MSRRQVRRLEQTAYPRRSKLRRLVMVLLIPTALGVSHAGQSRRAGGTFSVVEASIPEMHAAMKQGRTTSRQLVLEYLSRIATYEDKLHASITVNPKALEEADARDRERREGKVRGPLHGLPIALKDNIHTTDLP